MQRRAFYKPHIPDEHGEDGIPQLPPAQSGMAVEEAASETANVENIFFRLLLPHSHVGFSSTFLIKISFIFPQSLH